jgi:hypothetical protein
MKLWRAWYSCPHNGLLYVWATSERNVRQLARNDWGILKAVEVERVEIPTTKAELAEWLNKNFSRDNG